MHFHARKQWDRHTRMYTCAHTHMHTHTHTPPQSSGRLWCSNEYHLELTLGREELPDSQEQSQASLGTTAIDRPPRHWMAPIITLAHSSLLMASMRK